MTYLKTILLSILAMVLTNVSASAGIAVLDIAQRNGEDDSSGDWSRGLYSATYMCDIAGYDYIVTTNLQEAMNQDLILISTCLTKKSFSREEWQSIDNWVSDGGILLSPAMRAVDSSSKDIVAPLFGVDTSKEIVKSNERTIINWNPVYYDDKELEYFDEDHERATSIGQVKSFSFAADGCDILAHYGDGSPAVGRNARGKGRAYIVPVAWRDLIQRNQLNKDQKSSREYNNGFEPSSDIWALFLRSIYASLKNISVWKFTVPDGYTQLLVPTHDCDSRTAYDEMHFMADYEKSLGLCGHYFLTVHYFSDKVNFGHSYLSDFYNNETIPKAASLIADGHTVGSHSICHFPDFNKTDNVDVLNREDYAFRATCEDGVSRGASTWAEIVMSKQILQEDLGNNVRSFRSGHLCVNKDFHAMLKEGDYSFQSCYTGGDILSEFPFFGRFDNQWEGDQSNVLTMQLHISDVYNNKEGVIPLNDETWNTHSAPDDWFAAMQKLRGNYASAVLLIHPNREWKMTLQKKLIDRLDLSEVGLYNFEDYGDFWLSRLNNDFTYQYDESDGLLTITTDTEMMKKAKLTYSVEVIDADLQKVVVKNPDGSLSYDADLKQLTDTRYLVIPRDCGYNNGSYVDEVVSDSSTGVYGIFDLNGRLIDCNKDFAESISNLSNGIYIIKEGKKTRKLKI